MRIGPHDDLSPSTDWFAINTVASEAMSPQEPTQSATAEEAQTIG
jgi:hypothetical protein